MQIKTSVLPSRSRSSWKQCIRSSCSTWASSILSLIFSRGDSWFSSSCGSRNSFFRYDTTDRTICPSRLRRYIGYLRLLAGSSAGLPPVLPASFASGPVRGTGASRPGGSGWRSLGSPAPPWSVVSSCSSPDMTAARRLVRTTPSRFMNQRRAACCFRMQRRCRSSAPSLSYAPRWHRSSSSTADACSRNQWPTRSSARSHTALFLHCTNFWVSLSRVLATRWRSRSAWTPFSRRSWIVRLMRTGIAGWCVAASGRTAPAWDMGRGADRPESTTSIVHTHRTGALHATPSSTALTSPSASLDRHATSYIGSSRAVSEFIWFQIRQSRYSQLAPSLVSACSCNATSVVIHRVRYTTIELKRYWGPLWSDNVSVLFRLRASTDSSSWLISNLLLAILFGTSLADSSLLLFQL